MIQRYLYDQVRSTLDSGLIAVLYGARQTGKTTLAKELSKQFKNPLILNCDLAEYRLQLTNPSLSNLKGLVGRADMVVIDEAQRVENIGLTAKILHDEGIAKRLLLTGSSSLDLANKIKEPLTGRVEELILMPLALTETTTNGAEMLQQYQRHLLLGSYPGIWQLDEHSARRRLDYLTGGYLYKDAFADITYYDPTLIDRLLRLLAFQIGSEVSYGGLAGELDVTKGTVMRYIDLLEKAFIVRRVQQYRRNMRTQVGRLRKVYFNDLGIRNSLINNYNPLSLRSDQGALWENFIFNERFKLHQRAAERVDTYYYRTSRGKEVDMIEESGGEIQAFECKYGKKTSKPPKEFTDAYPDTSYHIISPDTFFTMY
jgi:uncharacterized protein